MANGTFRDVYMLSMDIGIAYTAPGALPFSRGLGANWVTYKRGGLTIRIPPPFTFPPSFGGLQKGWEGGLGEAAFSFRFVIGNGRWLIHSLWVAGYMDGFSLRRDRFESN